MNITMLKKPTLTACLTGMTLLLVGTSLARAESADSAGRWRFDASKTTWQAYAGIGYRFSKVDLELAYRHIEWDFDDRHLFDDLNFSGPFVGLNIRF